MKKVNLKWRRLVVVVRLLTLTFVRVSGSDVIFMNRTLSATIVTFSNPSHWNNGVSCHSPPFVRIFQPKEGTWMQGIEYLSYSGITHHLTELQYCVACVDYDARPDACKIHHDKHISRIQFCFLSFPYCSIWRKKNVLFKTNKSILKLN